MSELLDSEKKACIKKGIAKDLDSLLGRDCSAFLSVMICRYPGGMTRILSSVAGEVPAEGILNYGPMASSAAGPGRQDAKGRYRAGHCYYALKEKKYDD